MRASMSLSRLFDEVARERPDELAVVSSQGACTYGELRRRADRVAASLRAMGVERNVPVGVGVPRSIESMVAVLGVLRAGGAYVPIDPAYPVERQRMMATDAGIHALVIDGRYTTTPPDWVPADKLVDASVLVGDTDDGGSFEPAESAPDDLLYIIYTSGSTGRPKGVCGSHAATLNRVRWGWEAMPFGAGEVLGHRSSLSFVDAGPEMFSGLLRGVPTAVLSPEEQADLGRFVAALVRHQVSRITVVPSILAALVRTLPDLGAALPRLRTWITSGEELTLTLLQSFRAACPEATLVNIYGATEVTGDVTCVMFRPGEPLPEERVPIGRSMAGAELLVLDAEGRPMPDGEAGELYVGGPVLARGYHRRPQEETVRFPRHPTRRGERVFKTGDLVRRSSDGDLWYLGRVDNLVKIRGVRIELEEIERSLRAAQPVPVDGAVALGDVAVVVADEELVAFVTPPSIDVAALRATAQRLLPAVMVPSRFVPIDALPLSPNGKCDRGALRARSRVAQREISPERRPTTPTEQRLAALWTTLLRREDIARDDTFAGLGGTSLSLAELMLALEEAPGFSRIDIGLARDGSLEVVAQALDGQQVRAPEIDAGPAITLTPMGEEGAADPAVIAMLVEASNDPVLVAATELPARMDEARARAYCLASDGMVVRVGGEPAGAGLVQHHPNVGEGVDYPQGSVQLEEWLLARWRGKDVLGPTRAWPLLVDWLAQRFDHEVSVMWEDHVAMIAILRARGYTRLGRSYWRSLPGGDPSEGWCEVWLYDLRPHRRAVSYG
jgi:amino acid adenylation domain-containing protein